MPLMSRGAEAPTDVPRPALTDPVQLFGLPQELKTVAHPIRFEGRVSYYDPLWKMSWLEQDGVSTYILLGAHPPPLSIGQRVRIEGQIIPDKGLSAELVTVNVLREFEPIEPLVTAGNIGDTTSFNSRMVVAEGFVDSQQFIDGDHVRLEMIVEDRPVIGWVKPDNAKAIPRWDGKFVRVQGLYSARFDPTATETTVELWIGPQKNVEVVGSLTDGARFNQPVTVVNQLYQIPVGTDVRVRGRVESNERGSHIQIRDETGQVVVHSLQQQRIALGSTVEVVGRVAIEGPRWVLRSGLYRKATGGDVAGVPTPAAAGLLERVNEIRQLSLDDAGRGQRVKISGLVTWSQPNEDFFFVQDVTGGVRVRYDRTKVQTPQLGKYLQIEGVTFDGGFVPAVDLLAMVDLGSMSPPAAKRITFDQAITGREDGQWVEMRGFVRGIDSQGDVRSIRVTTSAGEIVGRLDSPVNFVAHPGSLIRMRGVCEATADEAGRMTGVMLRVPFLHSITIEEDAPADYYDLPLDRIKGLRPLSSVRDMTRVRISGTVLHAVPGRSLYVEDEGAAVLLLTNQTTTVAPGSKVEAVGVLGREGVRILLREVRFKIVSDAPAPLPAELVDPSRLRPELDMRLVRVRGRLIDVSKQRDMTRFTLQSGEVVFEANLGRSPGTESLAAALDAGLELTGIYELNFDDSRQIRSFSLQLRSPADVVVHRQPQLWTVQRALTVSAVLGGCVLLGLGWITALRRRVRQQTDQLREQLERQHRLEREVQRASRLESLGVLAGGIAHDFNNLLTIIIGNLGLAGMEEPLTEGTTRALREIERGAMRARSLTQQLLTFAKGGEPMRTMTELSTVVKEAAELALHGSNVRNEFVTAPGLWRAHVDRMQIEQVVRNLVVNAVQAMPDGGTLRVALHNEVLSAGAKSALAAGPYVKLSVIDSGEGIAGDVLPRIFDPYFSTRKTGSGMGLATVYSILTKHAGCVEVESKVGQGTTFNLWLPATDVPPAGTAEAEVPVSVPRMQPGRRARVLLMDDEASIREIGTVALGRIAVEVVAVPEGAAALREFSVAQHNGAPFDLIILDLAVPGGMGGREAMELIRRLDLNVPAIVSSGYSSDPVLANFQAYGFQASVPKPYEISQLIAMVQRLLGQR